MPIRPSYRDVYGRGVDAPLNAMCYEATGGDGSGWDAEALAEIVYQEAQRYRDTVHLSRTAVRFEVDLWLEHGRSRLGWSRPPAG